MQLENRNKNKKTKEMSFSMIKYTSNWKSYLLLLFESQVLAVLQQPFCQKHCQKLLEFWHQKSQHLSGGKNYRNNLWSKPQRLSGSKIYKYHLLSKFNNCKMQRLFMNICITNLPIHQQKKINRTKVIPITIWE